MQRYWINQPSTAQPAHSMHGRLVLAAPLSPGDITVTVYFVEGDVHSAYIPASALSPGWPEHLRHDRPSHV